MDATAQPENAHLKSMPFRRRYFAQRVVYAWERPSIMRKHIYTGVMGSVYYSVVAGIFFLDFGRRIGVTDFQWGLMGGISSFVLSAQLVSALVTQRRGRRKAMWFWFAVAGRGVRLLGILSAFAFWHVGWPHLGVILIVAMCLSNFFSAMAYPPWMSWLADIIPEEHHGHFWGRRSAWIAGGIILTMMPAGFFMDWVSIDWKVNLAVGYFVLATVIGMLDAVIHGTIPEPTMQMPPRDHFLKHLLEPLRDRGFRPWITFNMSWTFSMTLGGALATIHFLRDLRIDGNMLAGSVVLACLPLLGGIFVAKWSGGMVDRVGPRRVLFYGHLFWALLPLFWIWATPRSAAVWLACSSLVGGASSMAAITAANKFITRFPPPGHRAMYVAVSSCLASLSGGMGALVAGTVLKLADGWSWSAAGTVLTGFHLLFAASFCLRLGSAVLLIRRIREPRRWIGPV